MNPLGDVAALYIAEGLRANASLTSLRLTAMEKITDPGFLVIGPEGGVAIAEALMANSGLTYLDLNCCSVLHGCPFLWLFFISVSDNKIGIPGGTRIFEMLQVNSTLKEIHLKSMRMCGA